MPRFGLVYYRFNQRIVFAVPSPPVDVTVTSNSSEHLTVSWKSPINPNGNITHYEVVIEIEDYNQEFIYSKLYCTQQAGKPGDCRDMWVF